MRFASVLRRAGSNARLSALLLIPAISSAQGTPDGAPIAVHWSVSGSRPDAFDINRDTTVTHGSGASIHFVAKDEPCGFATVMTRIPAAPYIGQRVHLTAYLRAAALTGGGVVWVRADGNGGNVVAFNSTQATPLRGTTGWTAIETSLDVPPDATLLAFGVYSNGRGALWADDVTLTSDSGGPRLSFGFGDPGVFSPLKWPPVAAGRCDAPRALSDRELANVSAFSRALGYVRFFHPSAEAVSVNWDAFAIQGVRAVEGAPTADSLARALRGVFGPIAPSVTFTRTSDPEEPAVPRPAGSTHVIFWQHAGVGTPSGDVARASPQTVYRSERVIAPLAAVGSRVSLPYGRASVSDTVPPVPDPAHLLHLALDGGVSVRLPVALYTSDSVVPDSMKTARPRAYNGNWYAEDRGTRLADVALAWSLFQQFYPYFDVVHTDWPGALQSALRRAGTDRDSEMFKATLQRMVASLHDGHGNVALPSFGLAMPDVRLGWAEGRVVVTAPGDSGAVRGVERGDIVESVDGKPIDQTLAEASALLSGATPQWVRLRALGVLLLGPKGTSVIVRLRGASGASRDVALTRWAPRQADEMHRDRIGDVAPGVMYVDLGQITDADFAEALPRLQTARGIVFDMRGYPSRVNTPAILAHLTDTTIHSAHFEIPIRTMPDQRQVGYVDGAWEIAPALPRLHAHIAFLVGGGSISYAESTMGVVESYHLGDIVGEPTAGTNGNINPFELPGGYTVYWTGMRVRKRDGTPHHGVGILPTVFVSPTIAGIHAGRDEVLERAVALVNTTAK